MAQTRRGKVCQCVWVHEAICIGILPPTCYWPHGPRQVGATSANACGCVQPHALAYFSPTYLGHMVPISKGKVCQCVQLHAAARIGIFVPPNFSRPCGSEQVGEKACQCVRLHAAARIGIFSHSVLGRVAQKSRGHVCQCVQLHAATRIGRLFPYCSRQLGLDK